MSLSKTDLAKFKKRLEEMKGRLTSSLQTSSAEVKKPDESTGYSQHQADQGTPAMTTRGMLEADSRLIAELIDKVISSAEKPDSSEVCQAVRKEIRELCLRYPLDGYGV